LNRAALGIFGSKIYHDCMTDLVDSREDVFIGQCFARQGVYVVDARHTTTGGTRYGKSAEAEYYNEVPYPNFPKYGIKYNRGLARISANDFFAFHLKVDKPRLSKLNRTIPDLIYRYHTYLHGMDDKLCSD
jgi:hypothetical protein